MDLILRPSGIDDPRKAWSLQLRNHDLAGVDYDTLCYLSDDRAKAVVDAGAAYWLFGEPDFTDVARRRRMRELEKELHVLRAKYPQEVAANSAQFD